MIRFLRNVDFHSTFTRLALPSDSRKVLIDDGESKGSYDGVSDSGNGNIRWVDADGKRGNFESGIVLLNNEGSARSDLYFVDENRNDGWGYRTSNAMDVG